MEKLKKIIKNVMSFTFCWNHSYYVKPFNFMDFVSERITLRVHIKDPFNIIKKPLIIHTCGLKHSRKIHLEFIQQVWKLFEIYSPRKWENFVSLKISLNVSRHLKKGAASIYKIIWCLRCQNNLQTHNRIHPTYDVYLISQTCLRLIIFHHLRRKYQRKWVVARDGDVGK